MNRYRSNSDQLSSKGYVLYRFEVIAGTGQWVPYLSHNEPTLSPPSWKTYVRDDEMYTHPHMQETIMSRPKEQVVGTADGFVYGWPADFAQTHVLFPKGPGTALSVSPGALMAYARTHSPLRIPGSPEEWYVRMKNAPLSKEFRPRIDPFSTDFSVWYLAADLFQLGRLAKQLLAVPAILRRLSASGLAGSHLAVQFGLLPTISDFKEFFHLVTTWGTRYSKMNRMLRSVCTGRQQSQILPPLRFVEALPVTIAGVNLVVNIGYNAPAAQLYSTYKYLFVCEELSSVLNRLKQFVDALGLLDPAAAWDLIPFSFLVDWFVPVGRYLNSNIKPRLFPADMYITDWCESIGRYVHIDASLAPTPIIRDNTENAVVASPVFGRTTYLQYARVRQYPRSLRINTNELSLNQTVVTLRRVGIANALLIQRVRRQRDRSIGRRRPKLG